MTSVSNYDDIVKAYKENEGKPWRDWLRFVKNLNKAFNCFHLKLKTKGTLILNYVNKFLKINFFS